MHFGYVEADQDEDIEHVMIKYSVVRSVESKIMNGIRVRNENRTTYLCIKLTTI